MASELAAQIDAATWIPRVLRTRVATLCTSVGAQSQALLAEALSTRNAEAVSAWQQLENRHLAKDTRHRLDVASQRQFIKLIAERVAQPVRVHEAMQRLMTCADEEVAVARAALAALGQGVSLADAHGIYVAAARKADKAALPSAAPHLGGPVPELSVFETVEVAVGLARAALSKVRSPEGEDALTRAVRVLALARKGKKSDALKEDRVVPPTSSTKGPAYVLCRAALKEAWSTDHVSARGTSIKSAVVSGLALGDEAWWLTQVDEQIMQADARTAWERRGLETSSPIVHLVWRGGDGSARLWLTRLASGQYALLAKLGRTWANTEGDLESVAATIPDAWFPVAMPLVERRR